MGWQDYIVDETKPQARIPANWEQALLPVSGPAFEPAPSQQPPQQQREASGPLEAIQAGYQGSATGFVLRNKLPDIVLDPSHAKWYEKALATGSQMLSELPEMLVGGALGTAAGTAVGGPAAPFTALVGGGAGAFAVPALIREAYIQALTKGAVTSSGDFLTRTLITLKEAGKEGLVGGLTMGAGGVAARLTGKVVAPMIGEALSVPAATGIISTAKTAAELGTMVMSPAVLEGKLPEPADFLNAGIVIAAMHGSIRLGAPIAGKLQAVWARTGITPEQVVADAHANPKIAEELQNTATDEWGRDVLPKAYDQLAEAEMLRNALPESPKIAEIIANPRGTITVGKEPNHINYNYDESPQDVQLLRAKIAETMKVEIESARGKESWDTTQEKAQAIIANRLAGMSDDQKTTLRKMSFEELAADSMAAQAMADKAAYDALAQRDLVLSKGTTATEEDRRLLISKTEQAALLHAIDQGNAAEVARAHASRKASTQRGELVAGMSEMLAKYGDDPQLLAKMMLGLHTTAEFTDFARKASKASTWEKVVEAWKAGILSGPVTHMANILGNVTFLAIRPPIDAVAAAIGMFHGGSERVTAMEPIARVFGSLQGMLDGFKVAWEIMRVGETTSKAEQYREAIGGKVGAVVRLPFRFLAAEDAMFKTMNERAEGYALAARKASEEGLNPLSREFRERIVELVQNPDAAMQKAMDEAGLRFTFNTPLGEKGQAVQNLVRKWHLELFVPFIRTPGNIAKELARMTPFAPAIAEWRQAAFKEGGIARDKAMSELVIGTGAMVAVAMLTLSGAITGQGSPDPNRRRTMMAAGWQPYSLKIGKTYYNYQRLQPIGTLMGLAADLAEVWDRLDTDESDKVPKMLAVAFANAVTNQTFLQGITNIVNAASDPARFGPRFAQQYAASLVPAIVGQPTQMIDPIQREVNSMLDAIKSRIPGERQTLLPKRDIYGAPLETKERLGGVSPITETTESEDKVRTEGERLGLSISDVPKKIHIGRSTGKLGDVQLTPEQHDVFSKVSGEMAHELLSNIVNAPTWDAMPDLVKQRIYKRVFLVAHRAGAAAALPPEERIPVIQSLSDRLEEEMRQ